MRATAQSISWITVSVTWKLPSAANTTGVASIGGSQKSCVSAAMRPSTCAAARLPAWPVVARLMHTECALGSASVARTARSSFCSFALEK